jgi:hypothetical protein
VETRTDGNPGTRVRLLILHQTRRRLDILHKVGWLTSVISLS